MSLDDGKLAGRATNTNYDVQELEAFDIVLTTYNMVRIQHGRMVTTTGQFKTWLQKKLPYDHPQRDRFPLFAIKWWILVLDEAHKIANPLTSISVAARALPGDYRVAMTGTPLQNDYTDIQGLLAFLRLSPWANLKRFKEVR